MFDRGRDDVNRIRRPPAEQSREEPARPPQTRPLDRVVARLRAAAGEDDLVRLRRRSAPRPARGPSRPRRAPPCRRRANSTGCPTVRAARGAPRPPPRDRPASSRCSRGRSVACWSVYNPVPLGECRPCSKSRRRWPTSSHASGRWQPAETPLSRGVLGRVLADGCPRRRRLAAVRQVAPRRLRGPRRGLRLGRTPNFASSPRSRPGSVPTTPIGPGECARIFTGAPMPDGADAVVMQEDTQPLDGDRVSDHRREGEAAAVGLRPRDRDAGRRRGAAGRHGPQPRGARRARRASGGRRRTCSPRRVWRRSRPGTNWSSRANHSKPGQIRNSNGPMLAAQAARAGGEVPHPRHRPRRPAGRLPRHDRVGARPTRMSC